MTIHLNPVAQAGIELRAALKKFTIPNVDLAAVANEIEGIISRAVAGEQLMMGKHPACGAENACGKAALCNCYCHKGHYRHFWAAVVKMPVISPDGTYHLLDRCKFCPDLRLKIIKTAWVGEKHQLVSLEYLIRGEQRVLTKEEWLERSPAPQDGKLLREVGL